MQQTTLSLGIGIKIFCEVNKLPSTQDNAIITEFSAAAYMFVYTHTGQIIKLK